MDPITAVGLASGILTFLDFAGKIVAGTYEIYQSGGGTTEANAHVDTIIGDLRELTADLTSIVPGRTKNDIALWDLAAKCETVSGRLQNLLNTLRVSGSHTTWKSLKVKIKSMRKEPEIIGLEKQLDDYRKQILVRLTMMLSSRAGTLTSQCSQDQSNVKSKLDQLEDKMSNQSSETSMQLASLRQDILKIAAKLVEDSSKVPTSATTQLTDEILEVRGLLKILSSKMTALPKENIILQNLFFPSMNLREEGIHPAEKGTFDWIFEEVNEDVKDDGQEREAETDEARDIPEGEVIGEEQVDSETSRDELGRRSTSRLSSQVSWPDNTTTRLRFQPTEQERKSKERLEQRAQSRTTFLSWLRSGRGVFHLSGKAGSGKSTLMKYLTNHSRTKEELGKWAAGEKKTLVFAIFYFWNSGDAMQASLQGLLRSILFETLKRCTDLIPVVFPDHWRGLEHGMFHVPGHLFKAEEITKAFEMLTAHGTFPHRRFCFFIDGLDEYKGDSQDHLQLAKTLQLWAGKEDVKICASSRPHIEFDNLSMDDRIFHLHELTWHDICLFSRQMIEKDDNFGQVRDSYLSLVDKIVDMSEGVFLWARLVVSSLLAGMLRHDTTKALEEKLKVIPRDIDELYDRILDSLDPHDQKRAIEMLLMTAYYPFSRRYL